MFRLILIFGVLTRINIRGYKTVTHNFIFIDERVLFDRSKKLINDSFVFFIFSYIIYHICLAPLLEKVKGILISLVTRIDTSMDIA
jgi:hypothetical protein